MKAERITFEAVRHSYAHFKTASGGTRTMTEQTVKIMVARRSRIGLDTTEEDKALAEFGRLG